MPASRCEGPEPASERALTHFSQTFRDHEIFLTGSNGFLGKVIVALLLDRFPDFKHLHVLVRPQRDRSAEERFATEVLGSPALAPTVKRLAHEHGPGFLSSKITVWPGDIGEPRLGLRAAESLSRRVGAIINCAGRVDFFPPVDESFRSNVDGVEHVVEAARTWGARLVHISTCYVCGEADGLIEESEPIRGFYPRRQGRKDRSFDHAEELAYCRERIRQIVHSAGHAHGEKPGRRSKEVTDRLTGLGKQRAEHWGWVNTYTYAKSLGDQIIAASDDLDYAIVRPAIVESALRFPFPGWIEGGRTAAPLVLMALGGMKDWPVRRDAPLEVVPVDLVAAAILSITGLLLEGHRHRHVYQLATADVNPIELGPLVKLLNHEARRLARQNGHRTGSAPALLRRLIGAPSGRPRRSVRFVSAEEARTRRQRLQSRLGRAETLMAGVRKLAESARLPGGRKVASWTSTLRTLGLQAAFREQTLEQYLPFVLHNRYTFETENIRAACALLSEKDRKLLPWDPEQIHWKRYWTHNQIEGIQKWVQPEAVKGWSFQI